MTEEKTSSKGGVRRFFSKNLGAIILLVGILSSIFIAGNGLLLFYKVALKDSIVPNINGPVSRFIANVDFETRTVNLDATISKTIDADEKIAIWRFGDGKVIKSVGLEEIGGNEVLQYQFSKPGTYIIGYSIVDTNDLSDEAFCTITFAEETPVSKGKSSTETDAEIAPDSVDEDCGKSTTAYNNRHNVEALNQSRSDIRVALFAVGVSLLTLVFTLLLNALIKRLFLRN